MSKFKIVYVVSTLKKTGPINILYGIIKNLDKSKFDVYIITLSKEEKDSRIHDFSELEVKISSLKLSRLNMQIFGYKMLLNKIDEINPDIIHSHGFRADKYISKIKKYITITTIHNYPHKDYVMQYGRIIGNIMCKKQVNFIKKINYPIACSKSISDELKLKYKISMEYIQNGININLYSGNINNYERKYLKEKLNIPIEGKIIISVGGLIERKNPIELIENFVSASENEEWYLVLLGDGNLIDICRSKANEKVIIRGSVNNVNEYLLISDIYVSNSKAEGMPNAVLEAMSCNLPVLLSKIEPHKEILYSKNNIGSLIDLKKDNLINIIKNLEKKDLKTIGKNAREVIENKFSDKKMSLNYQRLYLKALEEKL